MAAGLVRRDGSDQGHILAIPEPQAKEGIITSDTKGPPTAEEGKVAIKVDIQEAWKQTCFRPAPHVGASCLGLRSASCCRLSSSTSTTRPCLSRYTVAAPFPLTDASSFANRSRSACSPHPTAALQQLILPSKPRRASCVRSNSLLYLNVVTQKVAWDAPPAWSAV